MKKKIIIILCVLVALGIYGKVRDGKKKVNNNTIKQTVKETAKPITTKEPVETIEVEEEMVETPEPTPTPTPESSGIRKEFKDAMDSYEEFMDEYVIFMEKYKANPNDMSLLMDYASYVGKYSDMVDKFDKWEDEDLNNEELAYYLEVSSRVTSKLLKVAY